MKSEGTEAEKRQLGAAAVQGGLTAAQLKKIWAVARELNWDSERLHRYVGTCYGKESLKELTRESARQVIDDMERYVRNGAGRCKMSDERCEMSDVRSGQGYRERGVGVDSEGKLQKYVTPAQVALLRAEAARMGWSEAWILMIAARTLKRPVWDLHRIRAEEASKVVGAVRGFVDRRIAELGSRRS